MRAGRYNELQAVRPVPYHVDIAVSDGRVDVCLHGDIDLAAAQRVSDDLQPLELIASAVCIDLSGVTFLDSSGIEPIILLARTRASWGLPPIRVGACSPAALRLLRLAARPGDPGLDLGAMDYSPAQPNRGGAVARRPLHAPSSGTAVRGRP